jgi:hypothetical protein
MDDYDRRANYLRGIGKIKSPQGRTVHKWRLTSADHVTCQFWPVIIDAFTAAQILGKLCALRQ